MREEKRCGIENQPSSLDLGAAHPNLKKKTCCQKQAHTTAQTTLSPKSPPLKPARA